MFRPGDVWSLGDVCRPWGCVPFDWYDRVDRFLDKQLKQPASENVLKYGLENTTFGEIFRNLLPDRGRLNFILYPALRILRARFGYADERLHDFLSSIPSRPGDDTRYRKRPTRSYQSTCMYVCIACRASAQGMYVCI